MQSVDLLRLRQALEASWDSETSYLGVVQAGNPACGQCYPTARVVQHFFSEIEIAEGEVWTGSGVEKHFWNVLEHGGAIFHLDLTWRQFPPGSSARGYVIRDRSAFADSPETVARVETLLRRVTARLGEQIPEVTPNTETEAISRWFTRAGNPRFVPTVRRDAKAGLQML